MNSNYKFIYKVPIGISTTFNHNFGEPKYETEGASGMDLRCNEMMKIPPFCTELVPTGIKVNSIPNNYELQVRPRSGVSLKTGLRIANSPGTIDSDYRGEIKIIVTNTSNELIVIPLGERIAQLVLQQVPTILFVNTEELKTERGSGGFGSTND